MLNDCSGQQLSLLARRLQVTSRPRAHTQSHKQTHTHTHTPHASRGSPVALSPPSCASASAVNLVSPVPRPPHASLSQDIPGSGSMRVSSRILRDEPFVTPGYPTSGQDPDHVRQCTGGSAGQRKARCVLSVGRKSRAELAHKHCYSFETNILKTGAGTCHAGAATSSAPKSCILVIICKPVP